MDTTRKPQPGDIIWADRGLYQHFGIYEGAGSVIHFAAPSGSETNPENAVIHQITIEEFSKGDRVEVKVIDVNGGFNAEETLQRARKLIGGKGYDIATWNCEHFATWCKTGKYCSIQVDDIKKGLKEVFKEIGALEPVVNIVCNIHDIAETYKAARLKEVYPEQENDINEKIEANSMLGETIMPVPYEEPNEEHSQIYENVIKEECGEEPLENDAVPYNEEDDEPPPPPEKKKWYEKAGEVIKKLTFPIAAGLEFLKHTGKIPILKNINFPYLGAKVRNIVDNIVTTIKVFTGRLTPEQGRIERLNNETALAGLIIAKKLAQPVGKVLKIVFGKVGSAVKHIVQQAVTKVIPAPVRKAIVQGARKIGTRIASGVKSFVQKAKQSVKNFFSGIKRKLFG